MPHYYTTQQIDLFMSHVKAAPSGCHEWQASTGTHGYGQVTIAGVMRRTHRVAYEIAFGEIPEGMSVCHTCDNPKCVNPEHLFAGTQTDNMRDASVKGRIVIPHPSGERHPESIVTEDDVRSMRTDNGRGQSLSSLAKRHGISKSQVFRIVRRESWAHIT